MKKDPSRSRTLKSGTTTAPTRSQPHRTIAAFEIEAALERGTYADQVLSVMAGGDWWLVDDIAANVKASVSDVANPLNRLVRAGSVERRTVVLAVKGGPARPHSVYRLAAKASTTA